MPENPYSGLSEMHLTCSSPLSAKAFSKPLSWTSHFHSSLSQGLSSSDSDLSFSVAFWSEASSLLKSSLPFFRMCFLTNWSLLKLFWRFSACSMDIEKPSASLTSSWSSSGWIVCCASILKCCTILSIELAPLSLPGTSPSIFSFIKFQSFFPSRFKGTPYSVINFKRTSFSLLFQSVDSKNCCSCSKSYSSIFSIAIISFLSLLVIVSALGNSLKVPSVST
mmetsp:Transcript_8457/g.12486  ORF Transcript_8457/g.12486 Transcript_8457/m.12486 type:complete len:222 (-) Transcript_8457:940-1605(-)